MHIGGFPPKIYGLLFLLSLRNDVQYCIASVEGPSYCCGIHEVQRYVREILVSIFFLVYYVSIHVIYSFTLALGLQYMGNLCWELSEFAIILLYTGTFYFFFLIGSQYRFQAVLMNCTCSKSPINQATSKAMLTQMISIIFRRMETDPV